MKGKALSRIILTLLLTSILTLALNFQPAKATDTIYIRADGLIDPPTAPILTLDNVTYTLTGDITSSGIGIIVERGNVIVDGNGYTLQGSGSGTGFFCPNYDEVTNVTIQNTNIKGFRTGVDWTYGCILQRNNITDNSGYGVWGAGLMSQNIISNNGYEGVMTPEGGFSTISGNTFEKNGINARDLANIIRNNINGGTIWIREGRGSSILGNNVSNGEIILDERGGDTVSGNNITNSNIGIHLYGATECIISRNSITSCGYGIRVGSYTDSNAISENDIANCEEGIRLGGDWCRNNTVTRNIIANNGYGIFLLTGLSASNNTRIYHNNLIHNAEQAGYEGEPPQDSITFWDDGYPSGGNYWSDYTGVDEKSGPNQDQPPSDGIGDTPRVIDAQNADNYPLIKPWFGIVTATVDITPDTLNLRNKSKWVTAHIELSAAYSPADIDAYSIKLNDILQAELYPIQIEDYDGDGILDLMVKFNAANLMPLLHVGMNRIIVSGKVNGMVFEGVDTIKVKA